MELVTEGKISLVSYLLGVSLIVLYPYFVNIYITVTYMFIYALLMYGIVYLLFKNNYHIIAVIGLSLGLVFAVGFTIFISGFSFSSLASYIVALSFFHWSEYFITAITNPKNLSIHSYLLDHSKEYHLAAVMSCSEFFIEWLLFPQLKQFTLLSYMGAILVIAGEVTRKLAMITASSNFNHYVQYERQSDHRLVTHGIYAYCRHPSYVGWFLWSIATQLMIANPICFCGFMYVSWKFFNERIFEEEINLIKFFGQEYLNYQKKVPTGLPFIKGFQMSH